MKKIAISILILLGLALQAQEYTAGGENGGMGMTAAAYGNFWSIQNNQAGMAFYRQLTLGIDYQSSFGLENIAHKSLALSLPTRAGVFGLGYYHFGFQQFNEQMIGIAYAKRLGKNFSIGIKMDYLNTHIGDIYGNTHQLLFELGILAKPTEKLAFGAHIFNPAPLFIDSHEGNTKAPVFKLGTTYLITEEIKAAFDIIKNENYKPQFSAGIEYYYHSLVKFRIGYGTRSAIAGLEAINHEGSFFFGLGYRYRKISVDIATGIHQQLGWSPQVSLLYHFTKSKKDD